jgi:hypothetical protein
MAVDIKVYQRKPEAVHVIQVPMNFTFADLQAIGHWSSKTFSELTLSAEALQTQIDWRSLDSDEWISAEPGDYLVMDEDGEIEVFSEEEFVKRFDEIEVPDHG